MAEPGWLCLGGPERAHHQQASTTLLPSQAGLAWEALRGQVGAKEEGLMCSHIKKRKGWSKVWKELQKKVVEWLKNHPSIVESPTMKDAILVRDANTGEKVRVRKRLVMCSLRELCNSMCEGPLKTPEARDDRGQEITSDTKFRATIPPNFVPMKETHKVMCGCECCIRLELDTTARVLSLCQI